MCNAGVDAMVLITPKRQVRIFVRGWSEIFWKDVSLEDRWGNLCSL